MRFMVIVKGDSRSEAGVLPTPEELAEMGAYNQELIDAGIMLAGDGLQPTSRGLKVRYPERKVTDGPFTEAKEIIAGYWIWNVKSRDEAIAWLKRAPFREGEVELRPLYEVTDFEMSDQTRERFASQDAQLAARAKDGGS